MATTTVIETEPEQPEESETPIVVIEQQPPNSSDSDSPLSASNLVTLIQQTMESQAALFQSTMEAATLRLQTAIQTFDQGVDRVVTVATLLETIASEQDERLTKQIEMLGIEMQAMIELRVELIANLPKK